MSKVDITDKPPSYQESAGCQNGHDLVQRTAGARSQRVQQVVIKDILPILSSRALRGLSRSTIALIPLKGKQNTSEFGDKKAQPQSIGLEDSEETYDEVRLEESIDTEEFWNQPETLQSLQRYLNTSIQTSALCSLNNRLPARPAAPAARSFFGRKKSIPVEPTPSPQPQQILVTASQEDMSYRIENDFGLYETITRTVIIVRVDTKA